MKTKTKNQKPSDQKLIHDIKMAWRHARNKFDPDLHDQIMRLVYYKIRGLLEKRGYKIEEDMELIIRKVT
jgi:hypothetical protein